MTPTKNFLLSKTVLSGIVGAVVSILGQFHINLSDLSPQITDALGQIINIMITVIALIGVIVGRFKARTQVTLSPAPSAIVGLLLPILAIGLAASVLIGCGGNTFTYTPSGSATAVTVTGFGAWCENNLPTIRSATKASVTILADKLIKQGTTATRIAADIRAVEAVLQPLLSQSSISQSDLDAALAKVQVNDTDGVYADAISPAITLVSGYLVTLVNQSAPSKVAVDVFNAANNGLEDAAATYAPATSTSTTTLSPRDGAAAARVAHNHEAEGSSPSPGTI